jgi:putative endopeptidase
MRIRSLLCSTLLAAVLASPALAQPGQVFPGYNTTFLDRNVRPQQDFYHFALGGYEQTHPIPADLASMGIYPQVAEEVRGKLRVILEQLAATPAPLGSPDQKLGDFYRTGTDVASIDAAGATPLHPYLEHLIRIESMTRVQAESARLQAQGFDTVFSLSATPELKNPVRWGAEVEQGGLGLPSRDYYLDPKRMKIRFAYAAHVAKLFGLFGESAERSSQAASTVMRMETALAKGSLAPAELRDPQARYHPMSRSELSALTPHFDWNSYLATMHLDRATTINVATPNFFRAFDTLLASAPVADWKVYLRWKVINSTATYLSAPFEDEQFEFSRNLSGAKRKMDRWKKLVILSDRYLGMALGKKFVEHNFSSEARARAVDMLTRIRSVLRERIQTGWMSEATKKEALAKLDSLGMKIGYPDHWKNYSGLTIARDSFFANVMRLREFAVTDELAKVGQAVDRSEWFTTPSTVNAFYDPTRNEICFPAGRLQPPFFDLHADDALNYGATGVTMAHEMSHGFDDEGAQFDSRGALRNWWTPTDLANFTRRADRVAEQMSQYSYDGQQNNGKLVEGESIADQAGVGLAYEALKRLEASRPAQTTRDGFTWAQRFYLGYALCRANHQRPEAAHAQMTRDPHPLGVFRVNGPLSNEPAFYEAYGLKPGDAMMRPVDRRIRLWGIEP